MENRVQLGTVATGLEVKQLREAMEINGPVIEFESEMSGPGLYRIFVSGSVRNVTFASHFFAGWVQGNANRFEREVQELYDRCHVDLLS